MSWNRRALACAVTAMVVLLTAPAVTVEAEIGEEYLTVEQYIEQARPYLHMSCEGAWNSVEQDAEAYIDIVNKLAAISFINHEFDVTELEKLPADELQALRVEYYNEIGRLCRENPRRLLAGVIDYALVGSLSAFESAASAE